MMGGPSIKHLDDVPTEEMLRWEFADGHTASIWEKWIEMSPRYFAFWNKWDPGAHVAAARPHRRPHQPDPGRRDPLRRRRLPGRHAHHARMGRSVRARGKPARRAASCTASSPEKARRSRAIPTCSPRCSPRAGRGRYRCRCPSACRRGRRPSTHRAASPTGRPTSPHDDRIWYADGPGSPRTSPKEALRLAGLPDDSPSVVTLGWTVERHAWIEDPTFTARTVLAGYALGRAVNEGRITALPVRLSAVPSLIESEPPDVAIVSGVRRGSSLAFTTGVGWADVLARTARRVIVEIDDEAFDLGAPEIVRKHRRHDVHALLRRTARPRCRVPPTTSTCGSAASWPRCCPMSRRCSSGRAASARASPGPSTGRCGSGRVWSPMPWLGCTSAGCCSTRSSPPMPGVANRSACWLPPECCACRRRRSPTT